jgi:hypothetical protein
VDAREERLSKEDLGEEQKEGEWAFWWRELLCGKGLEVGEVERSLVWSVVATSCG